MRKLKLSFLVLFTLMMITMTLPTNAAGEGLMGQNGCDISFEVKNDRLCYWITIPNEMSTDRIVVSFHSSSDLELKGDTLSIQTKQAENGQYPGFIGTWHYSTGIYDVVRVATGYKESDIVAEWLLDKPFYIRRDAFSVESGVQLDLIAQTDTFERFQFTGFDPEYSHSIVPETRMLENFCYSGVTSAYYVKDFNNQWSEYDAVDLFSQNITVKPNAYQIDVSKALRFILPDPNSAIIPFAVENGNIYFDLETGTIVDVDTSITIAGIPSKINNISVTCIASYAFEAATKLTRITLPDSLTAVGKGAFDSCHSLEDVYFYGTEEMWDAIDIDPDNDILLGIDPRFSYEGLCGDHGDNLTWRVTPDGILTLSGTGGMNAFYHWLHVDYPIVSIIIENGITAICDDAFNGLESLINVTIPDSVTYIGDFAFNRCEQLQNPINLTSVTYIGSHAFSGCSSLMEIAVPDCIEYIGDGAFANCENLKQVTLPNSMNPVYYDEYAGLEKASIGDWVFSDCVSLNNIKVPDNITTIGEGMFFYCVELTEVSLPDSITAVENNAFTGCHCLPKIELPDGIVTVGEYAFDGCYRMSELALPDSIISIGRGAFASCGALKEIAIPNGVTTIEDNTFYECVNLSDVFIPISVVAIRDAAFNPCPAMTNIYYAGSETEWNAVSIGAFNDDLYAADIHYCSAAPGTITWSPAVTETPIIGESAETLLDCVNEGKSIPVTLSEETAPAATRMLAAIYDEHQRFLGMDMVDVVYTDGIFSTPVSFTNYGSAASMKLLLVDGSYAPVIQNLTVNP